MAERGSRIFAPGLLSGHVCVLSGAGSDLGRASASELGRLGATVIGCGPLLEPLERTAAAIGRAGGSAEAVSVDVRDERAVDSLFDGVLERHGRVDSLVNAAGESLSPAQASSAEGLRAAIELDVVGTWLMTHAAATKAMIPRGAGRVISITRSPPEGEPGTASAGAARAAVENMMRTLSVEWARFGLRLLAVAAGRLDAEAPSAEDEIAWLLAYLLSPAGDFLSGTVVTVGGAGRA